MEVLLLNFSLFFQVSFCVLTSSPTSSHVSALYSLFPFLLICSQSHWKKCLKRYSYRQQKLNQREILLPMNTSHNFSLSMMWKPAVFQCLSPAPTKRLSWNWKQMWKSVTNYLKLNKIGQHVLIKISLEMQKDPTVFLMVSYYTYATFFSLPISYASLRYQTPVPQWHWNWAATSSASMALTCWDAGSPLLSKHIHIQEEKVMGANTMGEKLSLRPPEVYRAAPLVWGCLAEEAIPKMWEADEYAAVGTLRTQRPLTSISRRITAGWKWDLQVHKLRSTT